MGAGRVVEVGDVDVDDDAAMRQWYAVVLASEAERPLVPWPSVDVALSTWRAPRDDRTTLFLLARVDGDPVGAGRLDLDLRDNTHLAHLLVHVAPAHRREGVGTALVSALEALAADHGRVTIIAAVSQPPGRPGAGAAFAAAHGYAVAGREEFKLVDLAATADRWPSLAEQAARRSGDYELVSWLDTAPEEHLDSLAHLYSRFLGEIPLGDLDIEPQTWDAARLRASEARRTQAGVSSLLVAAVAPDRTLAGYTALQQAAGDTHAEIDSTLVLPEHRGHALGLAMKVRLHQLTRELLPEVDSIFTGNAGSNQHMNAVNEALGYRVVEDSLEVQKRLRTPTEGTP